MPGQVRLLVANRLGRDIACAFFLEGSESLYGRYWGALEHVPNLHFEACYYQAIDFAIARGLNWVEAGAQGPHKIHRGYLPRHTYSAHWIADPALRKAIAEHLEREREQVDWEIAEVGREYSPYRKNKNSSMPH